MSVGADPGAPLSRDAVSGLRHELRTPVNHIMGYAEMLLEDLGPDRSERRTALEEAVGAARDVLSLVSVSLPAGRTEVAQGDVAALYESLREPQQRILRALTPLVGDGADAGDEFVADL